MNNHPVCVTGATGFLGRSLLVRLNRESPESVRILTRREASLPGHHRGDLLDRGSLAGFLPDRAVVMHLAYLSHATADENMLAASNLVAACIEAKASRLIHVSTAVVSGACPDSIVSEDSPCFPISIYEKTKLAIERLIVSELAGRAEVVILRPTAVFGENGKNLVKLAQELLLGPAWVNALKRSLLANRRFNLVYVDNVVEAIMHLSKLERSALQGTYIVSDDDAAENNFRDVSDFLAREWRVSVPWLHVPALTPKLLEMAFVLAGKEGNLPTRTYNCGRILRSGFIRPVPFLVGLKRFAVSFRDGEASLRRGTASFK